MTRRHFRNFIFFPCLVLAAIIFVICVIAPLVAKHYLSDYFEQQGEQVTIDTLTVNFFPPRVEIKDLHVIQQQKTTLRLKEAIIEIEILPLISRSVHISTAKIDGLELSVKQQQNSWMVAGIKLDQYLNQAKASQAKEAITTDTTSTPWSITLPHLAFTNSVMHLSRQQEVNTPAQIDTLKINALSVDNLSSNGLDWQGKVALSASVNDATLDIDSTFNYATDKASATINIDNTRLPIRSFSHFLPTPYNQGQGILGIKGAFTFSQQTSPSGPIYTLSNLDLTAHINDLDMSLDSGNSRNHIATKSTLLDLSKVQIEYASADAMSIKGGLSLSSEQSQLTQANQSLAFNQLKLDTDLDLDHQLNNTRLSTQQTSLSLNQVAVQLPHKQTIKLEALTLSLPIEVTQDEQGLTISSATTVLNTQNLSLALDSIALNNDKTHLTLKQLKLTQDAQKILTASLESQLQSHNLSVQQADITAHYQVFSATSISTFRQDSENITLQNANLTLEINAMQAQRALQEQLALGEGHLSAETLNIILADKQAPSITGHNIHLSSQGLDTKLAEHKRLVAWQNADLSGLDFSSQGDNYSAKLAQLSLSDVTLSEVLNNSQKLAPLIQVDSIKVQQLAANQDGAKIKHIITDSVAINVLIDNQKHLENLVFVSKAEQEVRTPSDKGAITPKVKDLKTIAGNSKEGQKDAFKAPYYIVLDAYDMTGKSSINVMDKSIFPPLQRPLEINRLSLRNFNTKDKDQAAVIELQAKSGKYTSIENTIRVWPMADELTMKSTLIIREAELPPYSAYIVDMLGYQIDSGQLDLDLVLNANEGKLDGNSHIVLREFDLGGHQASNSVIKTGVVPLNLAVSVLKDSDNNIDLNIPLSGNIDSPEFGWQDFLLLPVRKALFSASSSYLIQTFVPYANVISIAQFAGDQLLKIRVEPLLFEPKEAHLTPNQNHFLEQLVALMKEKNESQLKACGVTSYLDLGLDKSPASIDKGTRATAKQLAEQRAGHLKDYLVANGISSSRIFLCSPEVDLTPGSAPRVELNF